LGLSRTNQDCLRFVTFAGYDIEKTMHAVHEKYVGDASLTEHDFRSFSATTPKAMCRAVERTPIRLDFDDSCDQSRPANLVHKELSQAFLGDL